jgi:hypothetical protein
MLPPKQGQAVLLRVVENLSYQGIGGILGCSEATARSHFSKGKSRVIYGKSHAFSEPHHIELWVGYGNRFRIRSGNKVTFANNDFVKTFDLETRSECNKKHKHNYDELSTQKIILPGRGI